MKYFDSPFLYNIQTDWIELEIPIIFVLLLLLLSLKKDFSLLQIWENDTNYIQYIGFENLDVVC